MIKSIFSVKDVKVAAYMPPFFMESDVSAQRALYELAIDPKTQISKYPSDFELWSLGTYDDASGELVSNVRYISSAHTVSGAVLPVSDGA